MARSEPQSRLPAGSFYRQREQAFPRGTQITVEDLFFNVPARRKFLRSESYELSQITTYCTHYALAFPEIHFLLKSAASRSCPRLRRLVSANAFFRFSARIFSINLWNTKRASDDPA